MEGVTIKFGPIVLLSHKEEETTSNIFTHSGIPLNTAPVLLIYQVLEEIPISL